MSNPEFKNFIRYSAKDFNTRYPNFKRDKLVGYRLARGIINCPIQYKTLKNIKKLTPLIIDEVSQKSNGKFVIKATIGKQADRVLCVFKDDEGRFKDIIRNTEWFNNASELIKFITTRVIRLKCPHRIIIEEFIANSSLSENVRASGDEAIPFDFKVYCVMGKVRAISAYSRGKILGKHIAIFNKNWKRIPRNEFYIGNKGFKEYPGKFPLPSEAVCTRLLRKSERLAKKLGILLCRFDFFIVGPMGQERIYFGEITPICGGIYGHPLTKLGLKTLYSPKARAFFNNRGRRTIKRKR